MDEKEQLCKRSKDSAKGVIYSIKSDEYRLIQIENEGTGLLEASNTDKPLSFDDANCDEAMTLSILDSNDILSLHYIFQFQYSSFLPSLSTVNSKRHNSTSFSAPNFHQGRLFGQVESARRRFSNLVIILNAIKI